MQMHGLAKHLFVGMYSFIADVALLVGAPELMLLSLAISSVYSDILDCMSDWELDILQNEGLQGSSRCQWENSTGHKRWTGEE